MKYVLQTKDKGMVWGMEDQTYLLAMAAYRAWDAWHPLREALVALVADGKLDAAEVQELNNAMPGVFRAVQEMDVFMAGRHSN